MLKIRRSRDQNVNINSLATGEGGSNIRTLQRVYQRQRRRDPAAVTLLQQQSCSQRQRCPAPPPRWSKQAVAALQATHLFRDGDASTVNPVIKVKPENQVLL